MKEKLAGMGKKLGRFRYPILILLLGILLLALPGKTSRAQPEAPEQTESTGLTIQEARLESLLSQIQGAGQVRVLLSLQTGEQTQYQTDTRPQADGTEESTVLYSAGSGSQRALVRQVSGPQYRGAVIVCQGADQPQVKLALVQAVASVTGLGADQITVVKMK